MHGLSSGTGRLTPPKIEIRCACGKCYRVPAKKAGKRFRCKNCRLKIRVPKNEADISVRSRKAILEEFGIKASAAEREYEVEKERGYTCSQCNAKLIEDQLAGAYQPNGLVCSDCQVAEINQRDSEAIVETEKEKKKKKKEKKDLDWSRRDSVASVKKKALAMGALFFVGIVGFIHTFFAPTLMITIPVAGAIALFGGHSVFKAAYISEDD